MGVLATRVVARRNLPGRPIGGQLRCTGRMHPRGAPAAVRDGDAGTGHATPSSGHGWREPGMEGGSGHVAVAPR